MIKAIPTDDKETVSKVFGRAEYFALYRDGVSVPEFIQGTASAEHGAGTGAAAKLADLGVGAVYSSELGPKASDALKAAGIALHTVASGTPLAQAAEGY